MNLISSLIPSISQQPAACAERSCSESAPTVKPAYRIDETPEAWALTVDLPGVDKAGLELTVDESQLRILGRRSWKAPEGWTTLYRETSGAAFELVIEHDNAIDAEKIHAELKEGVLRASLPKAAAIKPRKIAVN